MSKVKKLLAMLMAVVMTLGMSVTAFAATNNTGDIIVQGLVKENTKVEVYQILKADTNVNNWIVNDWARNYVTVEANKYVFQWENLYNNLPAKPDASIYWTKNTETGTTTFEELPLGAYLIKATSLVDGSVTVYSVMGADNTKYDETSHLMIGNDVTVYAKASTIPVGKEADDNFVAKGEEVTFTITTTFPSFTKEELGFTPAPVYKIVDTPTGLDITGVTSVTIGETPTSKYTIDDGDTDYTIDLSELIGTSNENAGKTVIVTYKAIVTADDGYSNTANAWKNDKEIGTGETEGFTASITVTKLGEGSETLAGAKFNVYKGDKETGTKLWFTGSNGVYSLAKSTDEGAIDVIETVTGGTVQVKGLDEGTYFFDEIEAPEGYSINSAGVTVTVSDKDAEGNLSLSETLTDTKLASLPSTGGIGTTIFTIGGCLIMIVAAGLFFATRRKAEK